MTLDKQQEHTLDLAIAPMLVALLSGLQQYWGLTVNESFYEISKSLTRLEKEANEYGTRLQNG